jgi:hypothetical protein
MDEGALQAEVLRLRRRVQKLCAVARILLASIKVFELDLEGHRVSDGTSKSLILRAIEREWLTQVSYSLGSYRPVTISVPCLEASFEGV